MQRHVESIDLSIRKMLAKQKDAIIGNLRKLAENNLDFRKHTVRNTDEDLVWTAFLQRQPGLQNIRQMFGALIANPADAHPHNTFPSAEVCTNICGPVAVPGAPGRLPILSACLRDDHTGRNPVYARRNRQSDRKRCAGSRVNTDTP